MNTILFTLEYPPFKGGVANYYENIINHWPKNDHIFVLANGKKNNKNNIQYRPFISRYIYPKWLFSIFYLLSNLRKNKINHILVGHILPLGLVAYIASKITKSNYSTIIHGMDFTFSLRRKRKKFLARLILKNSQSIICSNNYVADMVRNFLGKDYISKIIVVNPGINDEIKKDNDLIQKIISKYDLENKVILLSIGRLVKRKGFDMVVEAMNDVNKSIPNLQYVLIGTGPDELYIKEKQKNDNIIFINDLSDEEKWAWLLLCDIFITPSRDINGDFEGFGIVYLEANIAGKPVIAGKSGGVSDAVIDNYTGIMVDPNNNQDITNAIIKLASDKNLREKLGSQGRERALKEFNWQKLINKIYKVIN